MTLNKLSLTTSTLGYHSDSWAFCFIIRPHLSNGRVVVITCRPSICNGCTLANGRA